MHTLPRLDYGSPTPSNLTLFQLHISSITPAPFNNPTLSCIMSYHHSILSLPALPTITIPSTMSLKDMDNFPPAHINYRLEPQIISLFTRFYRPSYQTLLFSPCVRHSPLLSPFFPFSIFNGTAHRTVAGLSARP